MRKGFCVEGVSCLVPRATHIGHLRFKLGIAGGEHISIGGAGLETGDVGGLARGTGQSHEKYTLYCMC
jgi:hypothetical protein